MSLTDVEPRERVERFLAGISSVEAEHIEALVGDASNRAYFRVVLVGGESRIVALLPEAFERDELPFLNVATLFRQIPVRVPEVVHVAGELGALLLEDLGDDMLQDVVAGVSPEHKASLYREAIDIVVDIQRRGAELASDAYTPYGIAFDPKKFSWELDFFRKHFLEGFRGVKLEDDERARLDASFAGLIGELCSHPFVLCHRDYHARNLMVVGDPQALVVIDFQDARQGPRTYDLVSLLNDSYVVHTPELVAEMTERFENGIGASVADEYDVAALQRNLKALGTFGYQIGQRDNAVYERYVAGTLALVQSNLERNARWDSLRRILARHCEEIR